jgi:hypothetical protein
MWVTVVAAWVVTACNDSNAKQESLSMDFILIRLNVDNRQGASELKNNAMRSLPIGGTCTA